MALGVGNFLDPTHNFKKRNSYKHLQLFQDRWMGGNMVQKLCNLCGSIITTTDAATGLHALIDTITKIRYTIKYYKTALSKNEMMTRYALIDPLLVQLGWDLADPGEVVPEDNTGSGGKTDYTMGGNAMIVEAKKLDEPLDKHTDKIITYVGNRNVRYGVLTNGRRWKIYDANTTTKSPVAEFDITDSDGRVIAGAIHLYWSVVQDGIPRSSTIPLKDVDNLVEARHPEIRPPVRTISGITLDGLAYNPGDKHPKTLIHKDGTRRVLKSWVDLLVGVAEWLVKIGHLTTQECPIRIGPKRYLLHVEPIHPNGKRFRTSREIAGLHLYTNIGPANAIRYANKLITVTRLNPYDFKVD